MEISLEVWRQRAKTIIYLELTAVFTLDFCYQFPWFLANPARFQVGLESVFFQRQEESNLLTILHKQGTKLYGISHGLEWF